MGIRTVPRVPDAWVRKPDRVLEEKRLRAGTIELFPGNDTKLKCRACGQRQFKVWTDRVRCNSCGLYYRIENAEGQKNITPLFTLLIKTDGTVVGQDQAVLCFDCNRHEFWVYQHRLNCLRCHKDYILGEALTHWWALQPLPKPRKFKRRRT